MIRILKNVLSPETVAQLRQSLDAAEYKDGKLTASGMAKSVKNNLQLDGNAHADTIKQLTDALLASKEFVLYTMPLRLTPLMVSRYEPGMTYGVHSDNAVIKGVRTDVSFTLFLENPSAYDGGELSIDAGYGETRFKLEPGSLVLYPTGSLHRVMPVTRGARLCAVGWAQSRIRDPRQRETVVDIELARTLHLKDHGHDSVADLLLKASTNLQRMWVEN